MRSLYLREVALRLSYTEWQIQIKKWVDVSHTNKPLVHCARPPLVKIFTLLALLLLVITSVVSLFDFVLAYSCLLGGLIFILPHLYFAAKVFRYSGAQMASQVAQSFYRAETGKFVLSLVLFAVVFSVVKPLNIVALFLTYLLLTVTNSMLVFVYKR